MYANRRDCRICSGFIDKTGNRAKRTQMDRAFVLNGGDILPSSWEKARIMELKGKSIDQLKVGDSAEWSRTVTEHDIRLFAEATGDFNPVHLDQTYAEKTLL